MSFEIILGIDSWISVRSYLIFSLPPHDIYLLLKTLEKKERNKTTTKKEIKKNKSIDILMHKLDHLLHEKGQNVVLK